MFTVLTKPSFKPCRCRQRPWLRIAFPPVRRRSSLASCRIDLHAGQTKINLPVFGKLTIASCKVGQHHTLGKLRLDIKAYLSEELSQIDKLVKKVMKQ
jgi:hypothetical protein